MRINEIELYIPNYEETVSFYKNVLMFECLTETAETTNFRVGNSIFTLHKEETHTYYYHVAFNIPPNLFYSAKQWVQEKIQLSTEDGEDEAHFSTSKAKSFYFEDPAGNIVEYIARYETTPEALEQEFNPHHVLEISEIGLPTTNVAKCVEELQSLGIQRKSNTPIVNNTLTFLGEYEDGVYIIAVPIGRRWIFSDKLSITTPIIIHTNHGIVKNF